MCENNETLQGANIIGKTIILLGTFRGSIMSGIQAHPFLRGFMKTKIAFLVLVVVAIFNFLRPGKKAPEEKRIKIAWGDFPRSYDPRYATDADSQYLEDLLHCSLVNFDENGNVVYELIKEALWQDETHLKVTLKEGFKFSDGTPVTKEDVKATYDFFLRNREDSSGKMSPRSLAFRELEEVRIQEDALIFQLKKADAAFVTNLVIGVLKKDLASAPLFVAGDKIPSCGAFVFAASTLTELLLDRNSHHPSFDSSLKQEGVSISIVKDETTRLAKLKKGELDIVQNSINLEKLEDLKKSEDFYLLEKNALKTSYLGFNFKNPILKEKKVRDAIAQGLHKANIINYVFGGFASEADGLLPHENFYSSGKKNRDPYNLKKANKLLDEAGFKKKEGENYRFTLKLTIPNNPQRYAIARSLIEDFTKMGIEIKLRTEEWGKFQKDVERGLVDMWLLTWIGYKDPDIYRYAFAGGSVPPHGANRGWYQNPRLDKLLEEGLRVNEREKRKKIYLEVEEIVHQDRPYIFLCHEKNFAVVRREIKNFKLFADGRYSSLVNSKKESSR